MPRTLLLCFIHGFKGNDNTFQSFPDNLKRSVSASLGEDDTVDTVVYPRYETKGQLTQSTEQFLEWLKGRVMEVRKTRSAKPWPPYDQDVGVVLIAHSMGGFVAMDALFQVLNDRITNKTEDSPIFPPIQGVLTFDTPYNGLARSMFVYGAFSNYQKVSSVFNVMTALSAATPSALGRMSISRAAAAAPTPTTSNPRAWKSWQLIAVKTGTVGAIAAGGVAAYMHRRRIMESMKSMRNINSESVKEGYQQSVAALGEGLAYINRGNVGQSFQYLAEHFTFVGALMKQKELSRRLERMGTLKGVGIHNFYISLGENGIWSGGYFVPERTFCAVPAQDHAAYPLFSRKVIAGVDDEVQAHISMFKPDKNEGYDAMTDEASKLVIQWFNDNSVIVDDPQYAAPPSPEPLPESVAAADDAKEVPEAPAAADVAGAEVGEMPDESPIDIAAAASMVPLPDDHEEAPETFDGKQAETSTYMRYLLGVAQQAGTGLGSYVPRKMPEMPQMPSGSSFKSFIPNQMPQMPNLPSMKIFGQRQPLAAHSGGENTSDEQGEVLTEEPAEKEKSSQGETAEKCP